MTLILLTAAYVAVLVLDGDADLLLGLYLAPAVGVVLSAIFFQAASEARRSRLALLGWGDPKGPPAPSAPEDSSSRRPRT